MAEKYPALSLLRRELAAGQRTRLTLDPLWRAACAEASAAEFEAIPELHDRFMEDARRVIEDALHKERAP